MPYLGQQTADNFQSTTAVQRFNGDGSDTTFTLTTAVSSVQDVLVSVDGVVQDTAAYTIPHHTPHSQTDMGHIPAQSCQGDLGC